MSYANYPVLASVNKVSLHAMLPEVEVVLVKAVPWPCRLTLNWAVPESHSFKGLCTIRNLPMQAQTQVCLTRV